MIDFSSDNVRRNPFSVYDQIRSTSPVLHEPRSGLWMTFVYEGVKWALGDSQTFSSRYGPSWLIFLDPPRHTKLRALILKAFTPRSVANLEQRIRELSRGLLDRTIERGEMDLAADFSVPLPMMVIAEMIGIPVADRPRFKRWSDLALNLSDTVAGNKEEAARAGREFVAAAAEMQT